MPATTPTRSSVATEDNVPGMSLLLGTGIATGIVGGLAGGGGGIVTVPVLDHATRLQRSEIHGTSTIVNVFVAASGVAFYLLRGGHIDMGAGLGMIIGGVLGAPLGARFAKVSSDALLRAIFIAVLIVAVGDLLFQATAGSAQDVTPLLPERLLQNDLSVAVMAGLIGVAVGAWSAAMGLGGGLLAVPALVLLFGREQHVAEGTSLVIMLPNAISGAIAHGRQGTASIRLGTLIGLGALVGSLLGVGLALRLTTRQLEYVFVVFMIVVVVRDSLAYRRKYLRPGGASS
jgi:uncharacterized protein